MGCLMFCLAHCNIAEIILCMWPANGRRHYNITYLIGWVHAQNGPSAWNIMVCYLSILNCFIAFSEDHQCQKISQWNTSYDKNSNIYRNIFIRQFSNDIMHDITACCQQINIAQLSIKYLQTAMTVSALSTKNLIARILFYFFSWF